MYNSFTAPIEISEDRARAYLQPEHIRVFLEYARKFLKLRGSCSKNRRIRNKVLQKAFNECVRASLEAYLRDHGQNSQDN